MVIYNLVQFGRVTYTSTRVDNAAQSTMGVTSQFALRIRGVTSREEFDRLEQSVEQVLDSAVRQPSSKAIRWPILGTAKNGEAIRPTGKTFAKEGASNVVTLSFLDSSEKRHFLKALKAQLVDGFNTWTATDSFDGLTVLTSPLEPDIEWVDPALDEPESTN